MGSYVKHNLQAREAIKDAFLTVCAEKPFARVGVTDIAKAAHVSRSTFYAHFQNQQEVFDECAADFLHQARSLKSQLKCAALNKGDVPGKPFCSLVRNAGKYQALVDDPQFFSCMVAYFSGSKERGGLVADYLSMGLTEEEARAVSLFQISGCFVVATSGSKTHVSDTENPTWCSTQASIDTFIRGGVNALRSASSQPR